MRSNTGAHARVRQRRSNTMAATMAGLVLVGGAVVLAPTAASADTFGGYELAFQSSDHRMGFIDPNGTVTFVASGVTDSTDVGIAGLATGGFMATFVDQGQLWVGNTAGAAAHTCNGTPYVMRAVGATSSPTIGASSTTGDWDVLAAVSSNSFLDFGPLNATCGGGISTIFPAVSAGVAPQSDGSHAVEALMGSSGQVQVDDHLVLGQTAVTLDNSTAPAVAGDYVGGATRFAGWKIAAHGADDRLWTIDSTGTAIQTANALSIGSGVSIARLSDGGFEIAFVGSDGHLRRMAPDGTVSVVGGGITVDAGTTPSIAANASGGFEIAFQNVQEHLVTVDQNDVVHDTGQTMPFGASPAVTALVVPGGPSPSPSASSPSPTPTPSPSSTPACVAGQLLQNPGFESGATIWAVTPAVILQNNVTHTPRTGTWDAWLDGYGSAHTDTLAQTVTIPAGCHATLSFWLNISTAETTQVTPFDTLSVQLNTATLATWSNLNAGPDYVQRTFDVTSFAGQTVTLKFTGSEDPSLQTSFVVDDTSLTTS